jgi:hypothetical protein
MGGKGLLRNALIIINNWRVKAYEKFIQANCYNIWMFGKG